MVTKYNITDFKKLIRKISILTKIQQCTLTLSNNLTRETNKWTQLVIFLFVHTVQWDLSFHQLHPPRPLGTLRTTWKRQVKNAGTKPPTLADVLVTNWAIPPILTKIKYLVELFYGYSGTYRPLCWHELHHRQYGCNAEDTFLDCLTCTCEIALGLVNSDSEFWYLFRRKW